MVCPSKTLKNTGVRALHWERRRPTAVSRFLEMRPFLVVTLAMLQTTVVEALEEPITFDRLFLHYERYVAGIAVRLLGRDDADVDDVVQDVFWTASRKLACLHDMSSARSWLAVVTTRAVRRKLRRRAFRRLFHGDTPKVDPPAPGASPEQQAALRRAYEVLERLPIDVRLAWSLRHLEGEQLDTVAEACGCSLATVKRRIEAANVAMREVLDG
jgi:RNA polymerase sigma-70 factor (ECF subfamily)